MIISRFAVTSFLFASFALVVGCSQDVGGEAPSGDNAAVTDDATGGKDGGTTLTTTKESVDICARLCARQVACDPATDEDTCKARCDNTNSVFVSKIGAEFGDNLASCLDSAACRDFDDGTAVSTCVDEARAQTSVTSEATTFCDDFGKALTKCGGKIDRAACFESAKIYDADTFADAKKCFSKTCADLTGCVDAAFGVTEEVTPNTCEAKLPYTSSTCASCVTTSCCAADNACANNPSCNAYLSCLQECSTTSCQTACGSSYPSGKAALEALGSCIDSQCPASCGN
jgi:hypothetical protein